MLVFAQLRGMLDLVARDVLQPLGVPHLRIDGGYAPSAAAAAAAALSLFLSLTPLSLCCWCQPAARRLKGI